MKIWNEILASRLKFHWELEEKNLIFFILAAYVWLMLLPPLSESLQILYCPSSQEPGALSCLVF